MADEELDPTGAATTAGDEAEASAEHESGDPGTEPVAEATEPDWKQRYTDLEQRFDRVMGVLERGADGGSRAGGGPGNNPPTTPDPQTQRIADDAEAMERELEEVEQEIKLLQRDPNVSKDPALKGALTLAKARRSDLNRMGNALRVIYDKVLDIEQRVNTPEAERADRDQFNKEFAGKIPADPTARDLMFKGWRAQKEAAAKPTPPANGNGGAGRKFTPAPPPRKQVDVRGVGGGKPATGVERMSEADFDDRVAALQAAGDFAGARAMHNRVREGSIDLTD